MVIYDLRCETGHQFEGWFKDLQDYEHQVLTHLLTCPFCESRLVQRVPTASYINTLSRQKSPDCSTAPDQSRPIDPIHLLRKLHDYVDQNFHDVGTGFHEEALKIHYGEAEERNIRGTASREEVRELHEAGVAVAPLPPKPIAKEKLN
jgi:hypothetical protein